MSVTPEMIDAMIAAGLTREQMATLMKASLAQAEAEKAEKRAKAAAKKRRQRASTAPIAGAECPSSSRGHEGTLGDIGGQTGTMRDNPAAPLHGPLSPPAPPHTPLNPPTTLVSEPSGSAADAAPEVDHRRDLFSRGLTEIRKLTGKAEPQCRTLMGKWLRDAHDSAVIVMAAIDSAVADEVANPVPYIAAIISREAQRNGSGSSDLFAGRFAGGRRAPAGNSAVTTALARHADRSGIGSGLRSNDPRPGDQGRDRSGRNDPEVEDADWSPAGGYRASH